MSEKKIYVFILKSGDEIVAEGENNVRFGSNSPHCKWTLHKPLKLFPVQQPVPTPQGIGIQVGAQLIPAWAATGKRVFEITDDNFLFPPEEAPTKLQSAWIQATTGLQVSDTSKIALS